MKKHRLAKGLLALGMIAPVIPILPMQAEETVVDSSFTGVVIWTNGTTGYYYKNGKIDSSMNALAQDDDSGDWYFFRMGQWYTSYTGAAKRNTGENMFYRVKNGKFDPTFTGYAYCTDGVRRYFVNGVEAEDPNPPTPQQPSNPSNPGGNQEDPNPGQDGGTQPTTPTDPTPGKQPQQTVKNGFITEGGKTYYYINDVKQKGFLSVNGKNYWLNEKTGVREYTGVVKNPKDGKWYFVRNGVGEAYTGLSKAITDGKFCFSRNGVVDWNFTGVAKSIADGNLYYAYKGKHDSSFTGIAKHVSDGNWYFVRKGKHDPSFTGFAKSAADGQYYFARKGKLDWSFTGVAKSVTNNEWYHGKNGKLDWNFTGFSKSVANGKWYFSRKGKLDWSFTGLSKSIANGKWYFARKGELDWNYTGGGKSVSDGKWYAVSKGSLNWSFKGETKCTDGKTRYFNNGKHVENHTKVNVTNKNNVSVWNKGVLIGRINLASQRSDAMIKAKINSNGCGPTSLTNAFNFIKGKNAFSEVTVAKDLQKRGVLPTNNVGGMEMYTWNIANKGNRDKKQKEFYSSYGAKIATVNPSKAQFLKELDNGHPIIMMIQTDSHGDYKGNAMVHAQCAFGRVGDTIYVAEPLGNNAFGITIPYVRTVHINTLFARKYGDMFSLTAK